MPNRNHRPQKSDLVSGEDTRPLVVAPLENLDRLHNPKDIEVDTAAIAHGITHGGTTETHAEIRAERGSGGRKRSQLGSVSHHRSGRDISKKR